MNCRIRPCELTRQVDRLGRGNRTADSENDVSQGISLPFPNPAGLYCEDEVLPT